MDVNALPELAAAFVIVFARIGVLVMMMPGTGERVIPVRIRLAFGLLVTLLMLPVVRPMLTIESGDLPALLRLLIVEILIGLMIGLFVRLALTALQTAGVIIANQLALAFAQSIDPTQGQNSLTFANFMTVFGLTLIFATDLHHLSVIGLFDSYRIMPPGAAPAMGDAAALMTQGAADAFRIGVQISAPFLVFGIVFNLGIGVLSRLMPQFQVFFLSMPATILVGFAIFALLVGVLMTGFLAHVEDVIGRFIVR
jgi:flagellar biosynthetic protein FliR